MPANADEARRALYEFLSSNGSDKQLKHRSEYALLILKAEAAQEGDVGRARKFAISTALKIARASKRKKKAEQLKRMAE